MIQRIQSIFLLIAGAAFWAHFAFPLANSNESIDGFFSDLIYNVNDHPVLLGITVLGGILALVNIFLFRNRSLQLRLGYVLIVLSIFLPIVAFWLIYSEVSTVAESTVINDQFGMYLPVLALLFSILANRAINKDIKIVSDSDRLR